MKIAEC